MTKEMVLTAVSQKRNALQSLDDSTALLTP